MAIVTRKTRNEFAFVKIAIDFIVPPLGKASNARETSHLSAIIYRMEHRNETGRDVSTLLRAWSEGDQSVLEKLTPIVYDELHRLAQRYMKRERPGHSLQTTALVNEAYMRLVDYKRMQWQDRAHFFAVSAQVMRRILVEHARRRNLKRGAGLQRVSLDEAALGAATGPRTWWHWMKR